MSDKRVRTYDKEFKLNAVQLYLTSGKTYPEVSGELGIPTGTLVTWVRTHQAEGGNAFPGKGNIKPADLELVKLRKELNIVSEERDILKKALGIFSARLK